MASMVLLGYTKKESLPLPNEEPISEHVGYVTQKMFGAVGDGEWDDTEAINSAITEASSNGGTVQIEGTDGNGIYSNN